MKTVAVSNKGVLASGSTDETIRLLNLKKQRELGSLVHHSGIFTFDGLKKNYFERFQKYFLKVENDSKNSFTFSYVLGVSLFIW